MTQIDPRLVTANLIKLVARNFSKDLQRGEPLDVIRNTQTQLIAWAKAEPTAYVDVPIRAALSVLNETGPDPITLRRTVQQLHLIAKIALDAYAAARALRSS